MVAVFKAHRNVSRTRELNNFFDTRVLTAARDQNPIEGAARVQSFADGVDAGELVHRGDSLQVMVDS